MKAEASASSRSLSRRWNALGHDDDALRYGLSRHVVVGDTDKEAQSAAKRAFALWYDA